MEKDSVVQVNNVDLNNDDILRSDVQRYETD